MTSAPRPTEVVRIEDLKPHPRNYRTHPDDQLAHITESLREHGFYRNVVVARDGTILAGHGVVEAAKKAGLTDVPVFRIDVDPESTAALKILTGDNELGRFAETDDRALTELLKEIATATEVGLIGTGFDEQMLAALVMNTRPASEIADIDEAAHWVGMPAYDSEDSENDGRRRFHLTVYFRTEEDRAAFIAKVEGGLPIDKRVGRTWTTRYPPVPNEDVAGVGFEVGTPPQ